MSSAPRAGGSRGPEITADAYQSGVRPDWAWIASRPTVLIFHGRDNQDAARAVIQTVRNDYRSAADVVTVNIVDLHMYPRVMRKLVRHDLDVVWDHETRNLPGDLDPESHIVIIPDYDGAITREWNVEESDRTVQTVVLDRDWQEVRRASEPAAADVVRSCLPDLIG